MSRQTERVRAIMKMRRMRIIMIIGYGVIVALAVIGVTVFAAKESERMLQNKISSMTESLNTQMKLNLDSYLTRMEKVGTLAFAFDETYTYDATDESISDYDAINIEKSISDKLMSLCLMENFVDYGLVYRNNHTVGKVSNGTTELFGNSLYSALEEMITREQTHDGWHTGYDNNYERIYYVKRVHENCLMVISFYTTELEHVFESPDNIEEMTVRLTDENYKVVFSSNREEELGQSLPGSITRYTANSISGVLLDSDNLVSINPCEVGWYVISNIPAGVVMPELNEMQLYIYIFAGIAVLVAAVIGAIFTAKISDPMSVIAVNYSDEDDV